MSSSKDKMLALYRTLHPGHRRENRLREAAASTIQRAWKRSLVKEPNMITLERYPRQYAVRKPGQSFNARALYNMMQHGHTRWPHSREPITAAEKNNIIHKGVSTKYRRILADAYYAGLRAAAGHPDPRFVPRTRRRGPPTLEGTLRYAELNEPVRVGVIYDPMFTGITVGTEHGGFALMLDRQTGVTSGAMDPDTSPMFTPAVQGLFEKIKATGPWRNSKW